MAFTTTAADRVTLYRTDNGEPCTILTNMYAKTIRKRHPQGHPLAGQRVFSDTPQVEFKQGTYPCFLNPNYPDRDDVVAAGLAAIVCTADKLASQYDADEHGRHRHGREYRAWQEYRTRRDAEEDRRLRREEIQSMRAMAQAATDQAVASREAAGQPYAEALLDENIPPVTAANFPQGEPGMGWAARELKSYMGFHGMVPPVTNDKAALLKAIAEWPETRKAG